MIEIKINLQRKKYNCIILNTKNFNLYDFIDLSSQNVIITDTNVYKLYLEKRYEDIQIITVEAGEVSKSLSTYEYVIDELNKLNITRAATIIAFGGGVIGDLAGFVASTYLRGVNYIHIPTTLLAQVDASIGGKVGLNIGQFKNTIGAFHHPEKIIVNPYFLKTLPKRHFNNGIAEIIKYGLIYDERIIDLLESESLDIMQIIKRSILAKKHFVEADEFDRATRNILNFGHTIGHAIEGYYNYEKYLHGEAISIGMVRMLSDENIRSRIIRLLEKFNLPTNDQVQNSELIKIIKNDKKIINQQINLIFVAEIGQGAIKTITLDKLEKVLGE